MKTKLIIPLLISSLFSLQVVAQQSEQHIDKLVLKKKEKKIFAKGDSTSVIYIDTLIMNDKSSLQFFGKNNVKIFVKHAEIGNRAFITGESKQNHASNIDLEVNFKKLGSLYVIARGKDAINGTKTYPNGDAGNINIIYDTLGINPQSKDRKQANYLKADASPGGLHVIPSSDVRMIYGMIARAPQGLRGLPQGQIYSGSAGKEGTVIIKSN